MRSVTAAVAMVLLIAGCGSGARAEERVVRVDFQHDEFASHYWRYFPKAVAAHPGDTIVFKQEWTGEPHSVTMGRIIDGALDDIDALDKKYADLDEDGPKAVVAAAERDYEEAMRELPSFDAYAGASARSAEERCYLDEGPAPTDPDEGCPETARRQPEFTGRHAFYSSGFIAPEGDAGNTYRVPLADGIEPGSYRYYCIVHFPFMQGRIDVKPRDEELPDTSRVDAKAVEEIEAVAEPLRSAFEDAREGRASYGDDDLDPPIAGYHAADEFTVAIDEFFPRTLTVDVESPVAWTIVGAHTVSFDVPEYLPIYVADDEGSVERNPVVDKAAGGSPDPPPVDFARGSRVEIDGGTWDGSGFFSSGLIGSEPYSKYTLRVSKAGRYRYACLIHPKMVGTLVVRS